MPPTASVHLRRAIRASATRLVVLAGLGTIAGTTPRANPQSGVESPFLVKPYLQLGDLPRLSSTEPVRVLWQAANDATATWTVDVRQSDQESWRAAIATGGRLLGTPGSLYRIFSRAADETRTRS